MSQVTEQKGIASSTPSPLKRWLVSKAMTFIGSEGRQHRLRKKLERRRQRDQRRHVVDYFHQVDDGYSHLAMQLLQKFQTQYNIELNIRLVPALTDDNFPERKLLDKMSREDAARVAPYYQLQFPESDDLPKPELVDLATRILCNMDPQQFSSMGVEVSTCLWKNDKVGLQQYAQQLDRVSEQEMQTRLKKDGKRRKALRHYSGAMFYYEAEWYWCVDRFFHLEQRLRSLRAVKQINLPEIAPRPTIPTEFKTGARQMTLEFYASLRSPYTAIAWQPTLQLAQDSGVNLSVRPVLPMVMRGVPATMDKAKYIFTDASREAKALGVDYGKFYDPIGKPVMKGYSLYMWALKQGKGNDVFAAFLQAAFTLGINTNSLPGMRRVVELAGLDWQEAKYQMQDESWQDMLEENRQTMYGFGNWGVPSYRLLDAQGNPIVSAWGQDRLWLIAHKIMENS